MIMTVVKEVTLDFCHKIVISGSIFLVFPTRFDISFETGSFTTSFNLLYWTLFSGLKDIELNWLCM